MKKFDYKLWIIYICIAIAVGLLISACNASRKNVSVNKSKSDSSVNITAKATAVKTIDSAVSSVKQSSFNKITDISYEVYFPKPGADPVFIPHVTIKEAATKQVEQKVVLQKKDSTNQEVKQQVEVKKQETHIEKKKIKVGFNWWFLLLLGPLILLSPTVRNKAFSRVKKLTCPIS